ncbi:MAG: 50S ribosomal protein L24 [Sphingomonas sp.]|nr:50S ribosomal protein L24 [Sphingomonas sp.]|tara:strand:- start:468 stop:785 length:318 start_codon:yes stop_codon:yes gene_type:complete
MSAAKIKKGDQVIVLSGKDKGRTGEVVKAMPREGKLIVDGINVHARHVKPSQGDPQGGIKREAAPLHASKVALVTKDGKATRVRFEVRDGKKVRVAVKTGEVING